MSDEMTQRIAAHQAVAMSGGPGMASQVLCRCREGGWLTLPQHAAHQAEQVRAVLGEVTVEADPYEHLRERSPELGTEPIIRYADLIDGTTVLDEVIATNASIHLEKMNQAQWWMALHIGEREWHINLGAQNPRAKDYAFIEEMPR
jgi:hypothetical protein